jgi:Tol biopolymer transport system component
MISMVVVLSWACPAADDPVTDSGSDREQKTLPRRHAPDPREAHFSELVMLTDGGENAEAYFSFDGRQLVLQSTHPPYQCDQIFVTDVAGSELRLASTGKGRTTCAYFYPDGDHILYASTHLGSPDCPPPPDHSQGYVWPIYPSFDLFRARSDGSELEQLTDTPGYDAEATISPTGDRIVFTSMRDGDLDLYAMNLDGTDVVRLTDTIGYDGGAFYSPDGSRIVYRASHPTDPDEVADYKALLANDIIRPGELEVWVMNADGSDKRQVTNLGTAAFAPFFHPSGEKIIFSSNYGDPSGREFELFMVDLDGESLEQITFSEGFDGFPMFSPDGQTLVFCSNRHNSKPRETNVFVTRWRE